MPNFMQWVVDQLDRIMVARYVPPAHHNQSQDQKQILDFNAETAERLKRAGVDTEIVRKTLEQAREHA